MLDCMKGHACNEGQPACHQKVGCRRPEPSANIRRNTDHRVRGLAGTGDSIRGAMRALFQGGGASAGEPPASAAADVEAQLARHPLHTKSSFQEVCLSDSPR